MLILICLLFVFELVICSKEELLSCLCSFIAAIHNIYILLFRKTINRNFYYVMYLNDYIQRIFCFTCLSRVCLRRIINIYLCLQLFYCGSNYIGISLEFSLSSFLSQHANQFILLFKRNDSRTINKSSSYQLINKSTD